MKWPDQRVGAIVVVTVGLIVSSLFGTGRTAADGLEPAPQQKDEPKPKAPPAPIVPEAPPPAPAPMNDAPVLSEAQHEVLKSALQKQPSAVTTLLSKVRYRGNLKLNYTKFAQRVLHDSIKKNENAVLARMPALAPSTRGVLAVQAALDQSLTEPHVQDVMSRRIAALCGTIPPKDLREQVRKQNAHAATVLKSFAPALRAAEPLEVNAPNPKQARLDWRQPGLVVKGSGIVTAVQDQNTPTACGCCWAFATVGALEASYAKNFKLQIGGSEQFLLNNASVLDSTLPEPWSCDGGWFAFDMLSTSKKLVPNPGLARRSAIPYSGVQEPAGDVAQHPYKVLTWGYVDQGGDPNALPSDEALKRALCQYGPLAASILVPTDASGAAAQAWSFYEEGVFQDVPNDPQRSTNHAIVMIGWDDAQGAWIVKNSWGKDWGMSGFFYIKYGFNNIGSGACWVVAAPRG